MDTQPPPADSSLILLVFVSLCLVTLSMLFSVSESSFLSINKLRLRSLIRKKDRRAIRAGRLLDKKETMLNTLLVANELVNILLSALLTAVALRLVGPSGVGVATFVATLLLLVFGEITPKSVSTRHPDAIAYALSGFVTAVCVILRPFVFVFTTVSHAVLRLMGISVKKPAKSFTEEEIKNLIDVGGEEGVLEKSEHTMMRRVFRFTDLEARDIMVPRTKIIAVPHTASYRDIIELAQRTRFSRFPVYRESIDEIIGIIYIKDLLQFKASKSGFSVQNVMRSPLFIPGTKNMTTVQQLLNESRQSLAVVIDEYSGTDGLLTKEDITHEIFGSITHRFMLHAQGAVVYTENGSQFISGSARLVDVRDELHIPLESKMNETIAGWFIEQLGHLPVVGESVVFCGWRFTAASIIRRHIETLQGSAQGGPEQ